MMAEKLPIETPDGFRGCVTTPVCRLRDADFDAALKGGPGADRPQVLQVVENIGNDMTYSQGLLTKLSFCGIINMEHCYGALMASTRTDSKRAEKRQSFGFEIR